MVALVLGLWRLNRNGTGNDYYTAAIMTGAKSWRSLFFAAFDRAGVMAVDKPPLGLVAPSLMVRLFGLSSWTVLGPEVVMFATSTLILRWTIARHLGRTAGAVAGLVFVLTPIEVAVARSDNPDALLVLLTIISVAFGVEAIVRRSSWLAGAAGLAIGAAFTTKQLQGLLGVPALGLGLLLFSSDAWRKRAIRALVFGGVAFVSSLAWIAVVDRVPATHRPYIANSANDTEVDLAFGYNGARRLAKPLSVADSASRLLGPANGPQSGWLWPAALLGGGLTMLVVAGRRRRVLGMWLLWTVSHGVLLSLMPGKFSPYYTAPLALGMAALIGVALPICVVRARSRWSGRALLGAVVTAGVATTWIVARRSAPWVAPTATVLAIGSVVASVVAGHSGAQGPRRRNAQRLGTFATVFALLIGPARWSVAGAAEGQDPIVPASLLNGPARPDPEHQIILQQQERVLAYVRRHDDSRFELATSRVTTAAAEIVKANRKVIQLGGFTGTDRRPSLRTLQQWLSLRQLRWVAVPALPPHRKDMYPPPSIVAGPWAPWVRLHCRSVPASIFGGLNLTDYWLRYDRLPLLAPLELFDCGGIGTS